MIQILVLWFQEWCSPSFYAVWSLAADAVHRLAALGGLGVPKDRNSYPWYLHKKWSLKNSLGFIMGWLRICYSGLRWEEPGNSTETGMSLVCSGNRVILIILGAKEEYTRPWLCRQEEVPHVLCFVILPCRFLASTLYSLEVCSQSCLTTVSSGSQSFRLSPHPCIACFVSFSFICGEKLEKHAGKTRTLESEHLYPSPWYVIHMFWTVLQKPICKMSLEIENVKATVLWQYEYICWGKVSEIWVLF